MSDLLVLILKGLKAMFGQNALWEAVRAVVETRGEIKMIKLEEQSDIREIENDIKEIRKLAKKRRVEKRKGEGDK